MPGITIKSIAEKSGYVAKHYWYLFVTESNSVCTQEIDWLKAYRAKYDITIFTIDVDQFPDLAERYEIVQCPLLMIFDSDYRALEALLGFFPERLTKFIARWNIK